MLQVYTGEGKGKTTAALGVAFRALGHGKSVFMIQFMKSGKSGETRAAKSFNCFNISSFGRGCILDKDSLTAEDIALAKQALACAKEIVSLGKHDILILDELNTAVDIGLIDEDSAIDLISIAKDKLEVIVTGRGAPRKFIEIADLVSEIKEVKHYYQKGIKARLGIEY